MLQLISLPLQGLNLCLQLLHLLLQLLNQAIAVRNYYLSNPDCCIATLLQARHTAALLRNCRSELSLSSCSIWSCSC
jgi:hypothetical protein